MDTFCANARNLNIRLCFLFFFFQVGKEFTCRLDLDGAVTWKVPDFFPSACSMVSSTPTHRDAVVNAFVYVHQTLHKANVRLVKRGSRTMAITPRYARMSFISVMSP